MLDLFQEESFLSPSRRTGRNVFNIFFFFFFGGQDADRSKPVWGGGCERRI